MNTKSIDKEVLPGNWVELNPSAMEELYKALEQLYFAIKDIPEMEHLDGNLLQAKEALNNAKL